ncbi:MAG: hypothetical protein OIF50_03230 [Flavobacteriaceae bacterium]|nr:hypothetical protein [Flavobacteriaceae bacterium]
MENNNSRRKFFGQALAVLALSSTFTYAQHTDFWKRSPTSDLNILFAELDKLTKTFLQGHVSGEEWIYYFDKLMKRHWKKDTIQDLLTLIDFEKVAKHYDFTKKGRSHYEVQTPLLYEKGNQKIHTKLIGISNGHNVPPHAHENMGSTSIVLSGNVRVRSYDRVETNADGLLIRPLTDQHQTVGDWSSISSEKSNIHWFNTMNSDVFLLNVNVEGISGKATPGIRIDPKPISPDTGLIDAKYLSKQEAEEKYG